MRVAVVGSGPAGFYAAGALLSADPPVEVDMIERLPTPWGLVRLGVAPDHPKLKTVSRAFERIADQAGFRFLGNVEVGRDLKHEDLVRLYDAVIYAVGAQTDRRLGIPGEDLPGSWAATELVAWYNGHPDYQRLEFDLSVERAVVIGNGNVALDVARMLALTQEELAPTDATDASIAAIASSAIREIVVVGRRGPAEAAFTTPELQEMGELAGADVVVDPADLEGAEPRGTNAERNLAVLQGFAGREPEGKPRRVVFRFYHSPVAILGEERVEGVELVRNELDANERAVPTDERETLPCGLVFRSVGYHGVELPGVVFDVRSGTIPNEGGRVEPGVYVAGWIKRGPTGVIGTNKKDAAETVETLLEDAAAGRLEPKPDASAAAVDALLVERGVRVVEYAGWTAIDEAERGAGETLGRPRIKLCSWDELLAAAEPVASEAGLEPQVSALPQKGDKPSS
jgi:ferredoxin--NADP+ reductase